MSTLIDGPPSTWTTLLSESSRPKAARHIFITQTSQSIKGRYTISPVAHDAYPPVYDLPPEENKQKNSSSAAFETKNSAVNVTVWVEGNKEVVEGKRRPLSLEGFPYNRPLPEPGKGVAILAKSYMGNIKIVVPQYTIPKPLYMRAKTHNGDIHVHIPPTFSGLLSWTTETGSLKPSKAIMNRYRIVGGQKKHRGVAKVGVAEWIKDTSDRGDSVELITHNGTIHIYEAGEDSDASACVIA